MLLQYLPSLLGVTNKVDTRSDIELTLPFSDSRFIDLLSLATSILHVFFVVWCTRKSNADQFQWTIFYEYCMHVYKTHSMNSII